MLAAIHCVWCCVLLQTSHLEAGVEAFEAEVVVETGEVEGVSEVVVVVVVVVVVAAVVVVVDSLHEVVAAVVAEVRILLLTLYRVQQKHNG